MAEASLRIALDYGSEGLVVELPRERTTVLEPLYPPALEDPRAALRDALRAPAGLVKPLRELVRGADRVAISVCDGTRPQPRELMLRAILDEMPTVDRENIVLLIATGTHRANTAEELVGMLGSEIAGGFRIVNHDARDPDGLCYCGETSTGVPIWLNRHWVEADFRITTGFVEPHLFAGFSGGPKLVAPGLAGLDTTMELHDAGRIGHSSATWGITHGNPVHDDVREIAIKTGVSFGLDVTLNANKEITGVFAGEVLDEHRLACEASMREAMRAIDSPFDVVVTTNSGFPLDQNLYQAVKGISAAAQAVKDGGVIICAAECRDGLPDHGPY
ncbi:MAG: nickel-dependent lactate racemase, partial [Candidatus Binatia bacterium]